MKIRLPQVFFNTVNNTPLHKQKRSNTAGG